MRRFFGVCTICFLFILLTSFVYAHPPRDIKLEYNRKEGILKVSMTHVSPNPRKHFIRKITLYKNGQEIKEHLFTMQTSGQGLITDISVEAKKGDVLSIKALCNEAGYAEASLDVN